MSCNICSPLYLPHICCWKPNRNRCSFTFFTVKVNGSLILCSNIKAESSSQGPFLCFLTSKMEYQENPFLPLTSLVQFSTKCFFLSTVTITESPTFDASMAFLIILFKSCLNSIVFTAI
jgi:hypothetical protein